MSRYYCLLRENLGEASAITRLFLIRYLEKYGLESQELTIRTLVGDLGIHDRGVRGAIEFLVGLQYLTVDKIGGGKRGRPKHVIGVGARLSALLNTLSTHHLFHAELIGALLKERLTWRVDKNKKQAVGLKNSERLLLAVLFAHADEDGEVMNVGFAELSSCTGLTASQLRAQISVLKSLLLIKAYTPGGLKRRGVAQVKSSFRLNAGGAAVYEGVQAVTVTVDTLDDFARSALMAYALVVVNGVPSAAMAANGGVVLADQELQHWLNIYNVPENIYADLMQCLRFFGGRDIHGRKLESMYRLICDIVADLLMFDKEKRSMEENCRTLLRAHKGFAPYIRLLRKEEFSSLVCFFSKIIKVLMKEIETQLPSKYKPEWDAGMNKCSVKIVGRDTLKISYRVKSDSQEQE